MSDTHPNDIPSPDRASSSERETRSIGRVALYAFLVNVGLVGMKTALAFFSNSLAVTAGAIDSGTDAVASLVLFAGVKLSTRKSASFPLGLYKIENLLSVFVAISIFFAGYEIARKILSQSIVPPEISMDILLLLLAGTVVTYLFGLYALRIGRRTGSPTLIAEGKHRQVDVLSSVVVLAAVLPPFFGWDLKVRGVSVDQIAAGVVLLFIARAGWELLSDGMRVLLDASADFKTLSDVQEILEAHPLVVEVGSLIGRNAGRFRFLQASVVVRTSDLEAAHRISVDLEAAIREKIPHVERAMIYCEPEPRAHYRIAVPLADREGTVSRHFGEAPYFGIVTVRTSDGEAEARELAENPHTRVGTGKGLRVAEWLVGLNVNEVYVTEDLSHKGPGYVFGNAGVRVETTGFTQLEELLGAIRDKQDKVRDRG